MDREFHGEKSSAVSLYRPYSVKDKTGKGIVNKTGFLKKSFGEL